MSKMLGTQASRTEHVPQHDSKMHLAGRASQRTAKDSGEDSVRGENILLKNAKGSGEPSPPAYTHTQYDDLLSRLRRLSAYAKFSGQVGAEQTDVEEQDLESIKVRERTDRQAVPAAVEADSEDPLEAQLREVSFPTEGTCQWVFARDEYKRWRGAGTPSGVLLLLAPPGTGKTVLAKTVCMRLRAEMGSSKVFAFFCKRKTIGRSSALNAVATFLYLLFLDTEAYRLLCESGAGDGHDAYRILDRDALDRISGSETAVSFDQIWRIFLEISRQEFARKYAFIVDAFDECDFDDQLRLGQALRRSKATFAGHLFITGRKEYVLSSLADVFHETAIDVDDSTFLDDAEKFVLNELEERGLSLLINEKLVRSIRDKILEGTEGLFLLLSCRLDELATSMMQPGFKTSSEYLQRLFNQPFPPVLEYFSSMLDSMVASPEIDSGVVILNLVLVAQEPLTRKELAAAYCFTQQNFTTEEQVSQQMPDDIFYEAKMLCGSILQITGDFRNDGSSLDIFHDKAREFLENNAATLLPRSSEGPRLIASIEGHVMMATACVRFLLSPSLAGDFDAEDFPFLGYAQRFWPFHVAKSESRIVEYLSLLRSFLADSQLGYALWAKPSVENNWSKEASACYPVSRTILDHNLTNILDCLDDWKLQGWHISLDEQDKFGRTALFEAIQKEKYEIADQFLELGADPRLAAEHGLTPLHVAVQRGHQALIKKCVDKGAGIDAETVDRPAREGSTERHSESPLWMSVYTSSTAPVEIFKLLYSLGARKTVRGDDQWPIIHGVAAYSNVEFATYLLDNGFATVHEKTKEGRNPLHTALYNNQTEMALMFIARGADVNDTDDEGFFPLFMATLHQYTDVVKALLAAKASTTQMREDMSALYAVAWYNNQDIARCLIQSRSPEDGIDEAIPSSGFTPLMCALHRGSSEVAQLLLSCGADVGAVSTSGWLPIHYLCYYCHNEALLDDLLSKIPDEHIFARTNRGSTALDLAAEKAFDYGVKRLLDRGADVSVATDAHITVLMSAAMSGSSKTINTILQYEDCMPNNKDESGWTALHHACRYCFEYGVVDKLMKVIHWQGRTRTAASPIVLATKYQNIGALKALLANGMPADYCSDDGITALYEAVELEHDVVDLLLQNGADKDTITPANIVPFTLAVDYRNDRVIEALKPNDASLLQRRAAGNLSTAVDGSSMCNGHIVKWMLDGGLKPNGRSSMGFTALHEAADYRNRDVLEILLDQTCMKPLVDCKTHLSSQTALMFAVEARDPACVKILIQKGHADLSHHDIYGRSVFDQAQVHNDTLQVLKEFGSDAYKLWIDNSKGRDMKLDLRRRVSHLMAWYRAQVEDQTFQRNLKRQVLRLLSKMFFYIGNVEDGITAREIVYGRPSRDRPGAFTCSICLTEKRRIGFLCANCPPITLCAECRHDEEKLKLFGCNEHRMLNYPQDSLFDRDESHVNDKEQTEENWLEELADRYEVQDLEKTIGATAKLGPDIRAHIRARTAAELGIEWEYPMDRQDVFDLCRASNWEEVKSHLLWYPRDIALTDARGDNMTMWTLRTSSDDAECLETLQVLSAEAVEMLFRNAQGETTIKIACERSFINCLTFLLSQYDEEFNAVEDKYSSHAIRLMLDNGWDAALSLTVERHFNWASRDDYEFLKETELLGLTDEEVVKMLKNIHAADAQASLAEKSGILLTDFEQPTILSNTPDVNKHSPFCVHTQCKSDRTFQDRRVELTPPEHSPDISESEQENFLEVRQPAHADDSAQSVSSSWSETSSVSEKAAYLCGFAGAFPSCPGFLKVEDHHGTPTAFVSYANAGIETSDETSDRRTMTDLLNAALGLREAIYIAQTAGVCCNTFTVLCDVNSDEETNANPVVELCKIRFETVMRLINEIERWAGADNEHFTGSILSAAGASAINKIRHSCHFPPDLSGRVQLTKCCKIVQFLSLGFLSFLGAHSSGLNLPILQSALPPVVLLGLGKGGPIALRPRKLACLGDMVGRSVLVFCALPNAAAKLIDEPGRECAVLATIEDLLEIWGPGSCIFKNDDVGFRTKPILAVALRRGFLALTEYSSKGLRRRAHWYPTSMTKRGRSDWKLPTFDGKTVSGQDLLSGTLGFSEDLASFQSDELLLISGLKKNLLCQIGENEQSRQETFQRADSEQKICDLGTTSWRWALRNAELNVGFQQYGAMSAALGLDRLAGNSKKKTILERWAVSQMRMKLDSELWNQGDFKTLSEPYGVIFSICSNFAMRVPLREAVAEGWLAFTSARRIWADWPRLQTAVRERLKGEVPRNLPPGATFDPDAALKSCIQSQSQHKQREIHSVILDILQTLVDTGVVDEGEAFNIAWPQTDEPQAGYQFPCSEVPVGWVRLLQDTKFIATFAIVTNDCLVEAGRESSRCRNHGRTDVSLTALHLLDTRVIPEEGGSETWTVPNRRCYLVAAGPKTGKAIGLTTRIACRVETNGRQDTELIVLPQTPLGNWAGFYKTFHLSEGVREAHRRYHPTSDWSKAVIVASSRDWRARQLGT